MSDIVTPLKIEAALVRRLRAVSFLLLRESGPPVDPDPSHDAGNLLDALVSAVREAPTPENIWLLCTAVSGSLPRPDEVVIGMRFFRLAPAIEATLWILDYAIEIARTRVADMDIQVVAHGVVVDVDHTARHDLHTGIQRVIRQLLPIWARRPRHRSSSVEHSRPGDAHTFAGGAQSVAPMGTRGVRRSGLKHIRPGGTVAKRHCTAGGAISRLMRPASCTCSVLK